MIRHLSRLSVFRVSARVLLVTMIATSVPLDAVASAHQSTGAPQLAKASAEPAPSITVTVNRTLPKFTPPTSHPVFSDSPTVEEIFRAAVFTEPLVPIGGEPSTAENAALARALTTYRTQGASRGLAALTPFLSARPESPWRASLLVNVATLLEQVGAFSQALNAADEAWWITKDATDQRGRAVADLAMAEAVTIAAMFGQTAQVARRLEDYGDRGVRGSAGARIARARETLAAMNARPDAVIASGPEALRILLKHRNNNVSSALPKALSTYRPTAAGISLAELHRLAADSGLHLRMAERTTARDLPGVPFVAHWKLGHFSAVVERDGNRVRVVDPALGGTRWITESMLLEEISGYVLAASDALPEGWQSVSSEDAAGVVGHSCPPGAPPPPPPPPPPGCGMATYNLEPTTASLHIGDQPAGCYPPRGPAAAFRLSYYHREELQPQIFWYGNVGRMWNFPWQRFVQEVPEVCGIYGCEPPKLWAHMEGGGWEVFVSPDAQGVYPAHWRSRAVLARTGTSPLRYERRLADGSVEVYSLPNGGPAGEQRVFLTQIIDPQGLTLTITWDASYRVIAVTDGIGQVSTLEYNHAIDPLKVTAFVDPFGRRATLTYTPAGQLASITDTIGLVSSFVYDSGDFISSMTTPYGTTTFQQELPSASSLTRFIQATGPLGRTERVEYHRYDLPVPETAPASDVPAGFESENQQLHFFNTVSWDARAWVAGPGSLATATITKWTLRLEVPNGYPYVSTAPHSIKRPLEGRVFYRQPIFAGEGLLGISWQEPSHVARVLDDGSTQLYQATYNDRGNVTSRTDPLGRRTSYIYAANGIDLLEVRQTTGTLNDLLWSAGDYVAHRPEWIRDGAGQIATFTYNAAGQVLTVTNARQETTTYTYDADGRLGTVTGPVTGATATYTYDGYGRARTVTNRDSDTVTIDYDLFDRPTKVTYPDDTYEAFTYERLDHAMSRDRLGRFTRYYYDAVRRLVTVRDPAGRVNRMEYEPFERLIDANGHTTTWEKDVQRRTTREVRANGSATTYTHAARTSRLISVTDPKQQVTHYTYALDDAVLTTSYTNAQVPTSTVTFTYDTQYPRVSTMVDGNGTTAYTYHPAGQLGAGQAASIDGPLASDTITYGYDILGRVSTRAINGVGVTWAFDALGRVENEVNVLGSFGYTYDGVTGRLATVTYPNGQTSAYSYFGNGGDRRLQTIHHKYPGGATLSKFDYTYDSVGNIATWRQQADATAMQWEYRYDAADQLRAAVKRATDVPQTVLKRYAYTYDPAGNRAAEQVDDGVTGWTHDSVNRLVSQQSAGAIVVAGTLSEPATVTINGVGAASSAANVFAGIANVNSGTSIFAVQARDASGNTTTKEYEVDQAGPTKTFTFDANGNMTADGTRTFEWDAANRLAAVTLGTQRSEFTYDGLGHRVHIVERENGTSIRDARLLWADEGIVEERVSTGEVNRFFANGEQHSSVARYLSQDHLGSVRETTDASGVLLTRNDYDPYGRVTRVTGSEDTRFGFTGHYVHQPSGLLLTLRRAYDSAVGRWLSEDPLGQIDGPFLYGYVRNRPVVARDPTGEFLLIPAILIGLSPAEIALLATATVVATAAAYNVSVEVAGQIVLWARSHKKNRRPSTEEKHEEGESRRGRDQGGEKADWPGGPRHPPRQRPDGWKGPWPPKPPKPNSLLPSSPDGKDDPDGKDNPSGKDDPRCRG